MVLFSDNEHPKSFSESVRFLDIFDLDEIQKLQDSFSDATGVASIITYPDGAPITKPSNFCRLCRDIIRATDRGLKNCQKSDSVIGRQNSSGPIVQPCLSGGLWDAGTSITVGGQHIANWLIGQVRNEEQDEAMIKEYALEIGTDPGEFIDALHEVPVMSKERFMNVAKMLYAFVNELSEKAYKSKQLESLVLERKQKDEQVAMLAFALKSIGEAVSITDMDDKVIFLNESFVSIYGYTLEELFGKTMDAVRSLNNEAEKINQIFPETIKGGWCGELMNRKKDGTEFPILLSTSVIHNDQGIPMAIIGVARDITIQKLAEKKLSESLERFQKANMATFNVIWDWDLISNEIWWNDRFLTIFGYEPEEIESGIESWTNRLHPDDLERVNSGIHHSIDSGQEYWYDQYRFRRKNGTWAILDDRGYITRDHHGKAIRMIGAMQDVTERFDFIEELEKAKARAEAGDKLKTAFMHNISHELRTPLNGILGFSHLMIQPGTTDDEKEIYYPLIKSSSDRLLNTITSYMDISMIASGTMEIKMKHLEVNALLEKLLDKFRSRCFGKKLKLFLDVPRSIHPLFLHTDEELLIKTLTHLIDNAFKFTVVGEISLGYQVMNDVIEFSVRDTGIGVEGDALERIFDNFAQEMSGDTKGHEGSGLGLSIVKGLVGLLGGKVRVVSQKNAGSVFCFTLPYKPLSTKSFKTTSASIDWKYSANPVILIVEDEESNMLYLHSILRKTNVTILSAVNGLEAVNCCKQHPEISLILMDMKMPVMDGMEATKAIKVFRLDVPVIAITAFAMSGDEKKIIDAGCDDYLTKPVHQASLLNKLKEFGISF